MDLVDWTSPSVVKPLITLFNRTYKYKTSKYDLRSSNSMTPKHQRDKLTLLKLSCGGTYLPVLDVKLCLMYLKCNKRLPGFSNSFQVGRRRRRRRTPAKWRSCVAVKSEIGTLATSRGYRLLPWRRRTRSHLPLPPYFVTF